MSFRTVELFCDVAGCHSFSKAAEANGVSQSSVSQAVAHLEKQLGVELIDRRKRPLELTLAGLTYFKGCRDLLERFHNLEDEVQRISQRVTGRLRVAAIYSVGLSQMDSYVHKFQTLFPEVDLRVDYLHPEEVYARVRDETAELGLVSFPKDRGEFAAIPWQKQPFALVVPPGHRLAGQTAESYPSASVNELQHEDFVNFTSELRVRKVLDKWFRNVKVTPRTVHEFDNVEQIRRAVEDGVGVALLPAPTVARSVETGTLVNIELRDVDWFRPLGVIHKRQRMLSNAADRFVELLHDVPESNRDPSDQTSQLGSVSGSEMLSKARQ